MKMDQSTQPLYDGARATGRIKDIVERVQSTFLEQKTKPITFRLEQLQKLWWGYVLYTLKRAIISQPPCIVHIWDRNKLNFYLQTSGLRRGSY
jgi:hypothetical protein